MRLFNNVRLSEASIYLIVYQQLLRLQQKGNNFIQNRQLIINITIVKMRIKIAEKSNTKLLKQFPNDPFSDVTIKTTYLTFNLSLAYLSIDSQYFSNLNTNQVNLKHLPAQSVHQILRSLYGDQLIAHNIDQLVSFFQVIQFLDIQEYRNMIATQILNTQQLRESLQILEFCFENNFLKNEITNVHLSENLKSITNFKNYLKLKHISQNTINTLLLKYILMGDNDQTINHILENYFCRNHIQPSQYFQKTELKMIKNVWEKHHHKIQAKQIVKYQSTSKIVPQPETLKLNRKQSNQSQTNASESSKLFYQIEALKKKVIIQNKNHQSSSGTKSQRSIGIGNEKEKIIIDSGQSRIQKINSFGFNNLCLSDKTSKVNPKNSLKNLPRNSMK